MIDGLVGLGTRPGPKKNAVLPSITSRCLAKNSTTSLGRYPPTGEGGANDMHCVGVELPELFPVATTVGVGDGVAPRKLGYRKLFSSSAVKLGSTPLLSVRSRSRTSVLSGSSAAGKSVVCTYPVGALPLMVPTGEVE